MRLLITALAVSFVLSGIAEAESWKTTKLKPADYPPQIVAETRDTVKDGLPDGLVATAPFEMDIASAWYILPTQRYAHGVLGDTVEAGGLMAITSRGERKKLILPRSEVFEDIAPRLADLDGDGSAEIITIRSSVLRGASVTVYGLRFGELTEKASSGFIGRANRWLNIAGIAPFFGTSANEIALVQTPHIGGTLFLFRYAGGRLVQLAGLSDFSNHVIGSRELRLSAIADVDGNGRADIAIPSADRKRLRIIGVTKEGLREIAAALLPAPIDKAIGVKSTGQMGFLVGLEDGSVHLVHN